MVIRINFVQNLYKAKLYLTKVIDRDNALMVKFYLILIF